MASKKGAADIDSRISALLVKKMRYEKAILLIDIELAKIVHGRKEPMIQEEDHQTEPVGQNGKSLDFLVHDILVERSMPLADLVSEVMKNGYRTNSKNFVSCVQQAIHRLSSDTVKAVKVIKDGGRRQYAGIKMPASQLKNRLSILNQNKRLARTERRKNG